MKTYSITVKDDETGKEVNYEFDNYTEYSKKMVEIRNHYAEIIYNHNVHMIVRRKLDLFGGEDGVSDQ